MISREVLSTEAAILWYLHREGTSHGFGIIEGVARITGGRVKLFQGAIYPLLPRMEKAGLIEIHAQTGPQGGRPRRYCRLTAKGRREAEALLLLLKEMVGS